MNEGQGSIRSGGANGMVDAQPLPGRTMQPASPRMALMVVALHCLALWAFGSVMWVDAASYIRLAAAWESLENFRLVYSGPSLWWHNYVGPALPWIWILLNRLPMQLMWPVFAGAQHAIAAAALLFALRNLQMAVPSRLHAVGAAILCCLPFYQAFHNSFLTESLSSSALLVGFALSVRLILEDRWDRARYAWLLATILAVSLVRLNASTLLVPMAAFAAARHGRVLRWEGLLCVAACVFALNWFAAGRTIVTGEFVPPKPGPNALLAATRVNLSPSEGAVATLQSVPWPPGLTAEQVLDARLGFKALEDTARFWKNQGLTNLQVMDRFGELARIVRWDGSHVNMRSFVAALTSMGADPACVLPSGWTVLRGQTAGAACLVNRKWYLFFSWLGISADHLKKGYWTPAFSNALEPSVRKFEQAWGPWFVEGRTIFRDPLKLSSLGTSWFLLGFAASACVILFRAPVLGLALISLAAAQFTVIFLVPFGATRYAYPLIPIYILSMPLAWAVFRTNPAVPVLGTLVKLSRKNLWS